MYLNTHTYYSFKYGALAPEELLEQAQEWGITALALTDVNSTSACLNHVRIAHQYNIKPILGIDFRNGAQQQFVAIAKNNRGFMEINSFLSKHLHSKKDIPSRAPEFKNAFVIYPFRTFKGRKLRENEFLGTRSQDLIKLQLSSWKNKKKKLVALQTATFRNKREYNAHRLLRAIDNNCLLSKLPPEEVAPSTDLFLPPEKMERAYTELPHLIKNANKLLEKCSIEFNINGGYGTQEVEGKNLKTYTGSTSKDQKLMRKLAMDGLAYRYDKADKAILSRVDKELEIIEQKGFVSYFLINWDIVNYARRKGYFYIGRGSGANSIVAYLLRITRCRSHRFGFVFRTFYQPV